jgi:hypothetical protein
MEENLLPKTGTDTSSYKLAIISAVSPVALVVVLILAVAFTPHAEVREELVGLLKYLVTAGIAGGALVGAQYVRARGNVSVAKLDTYKAINAPPQGTQAAGTQINVTQPEG